MFSKCPILRLSPKLSTIKRASIRKILKTRLEEKNTWTRETASPPLDEQREGGEERLARAWVINGIDHAPMARSNGG